MKLLYRYDDEGFYVEPVFSHDVDRFNIQPDRLTDIQPPDFIRAKFEDGQWVEGADEEYVDSITPVSEKNPLENMMKQNALLTMELAQVKIANEFLMGQQAGLLLLVANNLAPLPPTEDDIPNETDEPIENPSTPDNPNGDETTNEEEIPVDDLPPNSDEDNQPETEQPNVPIEEGEVK